MSLNIKKDRMKKSCLGCRALDTTSRHTYYCLLRYKMDGKGTPLEICPKPTKNIDFVHLSEEQRKSWQTTNSSRTTDSDSSKENITISN